VPTIAETIAAAYCTPNIRSKEEESTPNLSKLDAKKRCNGKYHEKAFTTLIKTARKSLRKRIVLRIDSLSILIQLISTRSQYYVREIKCLPTKRQVRFGSQEETVFAFNKTYK
jgi:hypothetical protein